MISVVFLKLIVLVPRLPALVAPEDDESRMTSKISVLLKHLFARQGTLYRVLDCNANVRYKVARCDFGLLTKDEKCRCGRRKDVSNRRHLLRAISSVDKSGWS